MKKTKKEIIIREFGLHNWCFIMIGEALVEILIAVSEKNLQSAPYS